MVLCFDDEKVLVTAVDSCGAIGEKPQDAVKAATECVAEHTARVVLLEVACVGAKPLFCSLNVCNDTEVGESVLKGVRQVIKALPVVISTEKNMPTCMSAFGISLTADCKFSELKLGQAKQGDRLFCAGKPLVGDEVLKPDAVCFSLEHLNRLFNDKSVHAAIPCGSQGIAKEAQVIAKESGLRAVFNESTGISLEKSAGPATCVVFAADCQSEHEFKLGIPVTCIGYLIA